MAIINKTGIGTGNTIQAEHVTRVIDALSGVSADSVIASGSFTGSFTGTSTLSRLNVNGVGSTFATTAISVNNSSATNLLTVLNDGTVGIRNTSPQDPLHVVGNGANTTLEGTDHVYMQFYPDGYAAGRKGWIGYGSAADDNLYLVNQTGSGLVFKTDNTSNMYISASGNVGIGTITPEAKLTVRNQGADVELLRLETERAWRFMQTGSGAAAGLELNSMNPNKDFTITSFNRSASFEVRVSDTLGSSAVRILPNDPNSVVTVGHRSAPESGFKFDVSGSTRIRGQLRVGSLLNTDTSSISAIEIGNGRIANGYAYLDLVGDTVYTDYGTRLIRNNNGKDSDSILAHRGTGSLNIAAQDSGSVLLVTSNTPRLFISSSGLIGIGTMAPEAKLHVVGSDTVGLTENVAAKIGPNVPGGSDLLLGSTNGNAPFIATELAWPLLLQTSGSTRMYIYGDGTISIGSGSGTYVPQGVLDIRGGKDGDKGRALLISSGSGVGPDTAYAGAIITTLTSSHSQHINIIKAGIHPHSLGYVSGTDKFMIAISTGSAADSTQWSAETGRGGFVQDVYRHGFNMNSPSHSVHIDKTLGISGNTTFSYTDIAQNTYWKSGWVSTLGGPASLLKVYGGPTDNAGFNFYTSTGSLSAAAGSSIGFTSRLFISASGQIGMGTEAPLATLHVNRYDAVNATGARPTGSWTSIIENRRDSGNFHGLSVVTRHADSDSRIFEAASSWNGASEVYTPILTVLGNYRVGIGTDTPTHQLTLSTDSAAKPSTNTWTVSSDIRLKENIEEANYDTCYDIIKNLSLKRYTWKQDAYTTEQVSDRSKLGWIAQDVQTVFPKAVTTSSFSGTGNFYLDDCLSMNADQIYAVMYGTIKKLIVENESLKSELQTIKTHLGL